ncbi:MAG: substrate-binding domain-containing protein [Pseudomonas sp.]|uniref:substrate-binding domain-containing protein n=1 Tax=Pseudomonas sp. TaxID=306 RepID=UPI0033934E47
MQPVAARLRWLIFALLLPGPAVAASCIGVISAGGEVFWDQVAAGARQAGEELGVEIYFRGPIREGNVQTQLQMIDWVVARGCKALVIAPSGPAIGERVQALKAQGVFTLFIDRDTGSQGVVAVIATDNYHAGRLAGQHLGALLKGRGRVALIRLNPEVITTRERERGFVEAAEAAGLKIVFDRSLSEGHEQVIHALGKQLPALDALFTPNLVTTRAALVGLLHLKAAGSLTHIGFDSDPLLLKALAQGQMAALVLQQPYAMGYRGVHLIQQAVREQVVSPTAQQIELDVVMVTRERLSDPSIQQLLVAPALERP